MDFIKGGGDQAIFDFRIFRSFLAAISSFLGQSGQTKYLWNLCDDFYLSIKKFSKMHYDVIEKSILQKKIEKKIFEFFLFFYQNEQHLCAAYILLQSLPHTSHTIEDHQRPNIISWPIWTNQVSMESL